MALKIAFIVASCLALNSLANPVPGETPSFRNDYSFIADVNIFFKEHQIQQTWSQAVAKCSAEGASLFVPKSEAEVQAVVKFKDNATILYWVGIHDMFSEGEFITLDGKDLLNVYKKWGPGEPNNAGGIENCVNMGENNLLNDIECDRRLNYICAKDALNITKNIICETYDPEYLYQLAADRCYKLHQVPRSWNDAFKICKAEQSQLAIINSEDEANIFIEMAEKYPIDSLYGNFDKSNIFLGFNDLINNGHFLTLDGKTLTDAGYNMWSDGQPDNHQNNERCGAMFRNGKLNDLNCASKAMFICEKTLGDATTVESHSRFGALNPKTE